MHADENKQCLLSSSRVFITDLNMLWLPHIETVSLVKLKRVINDTLLSDTNQIAT